QVGLFDESLRALEDADLWIRLSALRPFVGLPKALVRYRMHSSNMTKDPQRMVNAAYQLTEKVFGPPEGDVSSWPKPKLKGYIDHYQSAAVRYMAADNIAKVAACLREIDLLSSDYLYGIEIWRGLARAHIPQEYRFAPSLELNWKKVSTDFGSLLGEFTAGNLTGQNGQYSRIKGTAFLALADEAGRNSQLRRAYAWLGEAMRRDPQIVFSRPYWGTIYRSLTFRVRR
ncbi:MAG: hypothetical protein ACXW4U_17540, partial [Anaerolineales bacterium]